MTKTECNWKLEISFAHTPNSRHDFFGSFAEQGATRFEIAFESKDEADRVGDYYLSQLPRFKGVTRMV
jgi:hypothetical protein